MGRFRVRWGDKEIEYEGEDSDVKYNAAVELATKAIASSSEPTAEDTGEKPLDQRGGVRKGIFAPAIKQLIQEGFFKLPHKRRVKDVMKALENKGLPVKDKTTEITNACRRMLRTLLKGTKDNQGWVFWQD